MTTRKMLEMLGATRQLAQKFIEIHNSAAKEYKNLFRRVDAKMWHGDYCHEIQEKRLSYICAEMENVPTEEIFKIWGIHRPLTVLDSYPHVTSKQKKWLNSEVDKVWKKYAAEWRKAEVDFRNSSSSR
jgi:hypothetical protein